MESEEEEEGVVLTERDLFFFSLVEKKRRKPAMGRRRRERGMSQLTLDSREGAASVMATEGGETCGDLLKESVC